jgi:glycosyltransferase involved in cell wall biosynthesis
MPKLSILIVTYNAINVLQQTLDSIFAQIYDDYELIVVDGGSTDGTQDIIEANCARFASWCSEKDDGIYDAMNKAIKRATGEYLQFLNAGDRYVDDDALKNVFDSIDGSPVLVYGDIRILHTNGKITYQKAGEFSIDSLLRRGTGVLCHQAMFVKRENLPSYNTKYSYKAELNWYFDLVEMEGFTHQHIELPIDINIL